MVFGVRDLSSEGRHDYSVLADYDTGIYVSREGLLAVNLEVATFSWQPRRLEQCYLRGLVDLVISVSCKWVLLGDSIQQVCLVLLREHYLLRLESCVVVRVGT